MEIKTVIVGSVVFLFSSMGYAATDNAQKKIKVVKQVYVDFLQGGMGDEGVLRQHGTQDFVQILKKLDAISNRNAGEQCEWQGSNVIVPGQDYDLRLNQIGYSVLQNGRIRVQAKNFGEKFTVDFDVQCTTVNCKISDVYLPYSYKKQLATYAQKGKC